MPARVSSTRFVGRESQLAELQSLLEDAAAGRPRIAFVTGESGMGKTRLVAELSTRASAAGARVLFGECVELGAGELPYAPIVAALRPLARRADPVLDALGLSRAELARLLPELGDGGAPPPGDGTVTPKARIFEALLTLLERLGRDQPVVLVVEDVHWADRSTRDFLVFLARALWRERVLVVCTYRTDELHRRHPLRPVLTELERGERARRIELTPFTREELVAQLTDILGAEPDVVLLDRLLARSEGNPLFVEELLAAGPDGGGDLPPTLRDALIMRVEALPEPAQELLRVVAAGQRVDHDVLRDVSGIEGRPLREALRETIAHGLLVPDDGGRYAFRHALLREAVEDDLLPGERTDLHLALAEALGRRLGDGDREGERGAAALDAAAEVAHHYAQAGDRPRAFVAALRAAGYADDVHANGEAAALLERALELWCRLGDPESLAGFDYVELLRRAAHQHEVAGDPKRAAALLCEALDELDHAAEPARAAALLERLGQARWHLGKGSLALEAYDRALALLPAGEPSRERAQALASQAAALMLADRAEAEPRSREAIEAARAAGAPDVEQHALNTLGVARVRRGDVDGAVAALRASIAMAREAGLLEGVDRGYGNLADALHNAGRSVEGRDVALEGLAEPGRLSPSQWLSFTLSEIEFCLGDWDAADAHASADDLPRASGTVRMRLHFLLRRAELLLGRGELDGALEAAEEARELTVRSLEPQWHSPVAALLGEAYARQGRFDDARAAVADGLARLPEARRGARVAAAGASAEADAAQ
ncbi:MAG TPA: AAA family ATPase, partial [Solirubrobacteraceae bacterium]|nr:AAA family ATPase [Solirubrobacteraceae bacterium]